MGPQTNAVTHSILIFEKNGTDEKSLIFMPKVDIRSEPARPDPTRPDPARPDPARPGPTRPERFSGGHSSKTMLYMEKYYQIRNVYSRLRGFIS